MIFLWVAPFTGAWIEMTIATDAGIEAESSRTLHGCVD